MDQRRNQKVRKHFEKKDKDKQKHVILQSSVKRKIYGYKFLLKKRSTISNHSLRNASYSSISALKIPWTEELVLQFMGCKQLDMTEQLSTNAHHPTSGKEENP